MILVGTDRVLSHLDDFDVTKRLVDAMSNFQNFSKLKKSRFLAKKTLVL